MFIDHLVMLFKRPEVEEKQFTYYGKPAQLDKYTVEVSGAVVQRLSSPKSEEKPAVNIEFTCTL